MKRTSNHSEQRLFREEVLSFTREICVCAHLTQTRDALEKCAEMRISMEQVTAQDFQIIDNCLMIRLPEEIDHHGAGVICEQADRLLVKKEVNHVVFDFEQTRFMDSSGIGIIMGRYRKISCFGGKVYCLHADRQIQRILRMSGLNKIVEVLES